MSTVNINLNILRIEDSEVLRPCCFKGEEPCHLCTENPCPRVTVFKKDVKAEPNLTQAGVYTYTYDFTAGEVYGIDAFAWRFQALEFNSNLLVEEEIVGDLRDQIHKKILITEAGDYNVSISIYTPDGTPSEKPPRRRYN